MNYSGIREKILLSATEIAADIPDTAYRADAGCARETLSAGKASEGIYSGNSGILLFLEELYRKRRDDRYLEVIENNISWLGHYSPCGRELPGSTSPQIIRI